MARSARLLAPDRREPSAGCSSFWAAIPAVVDGGGCVVAAHRYCPANEDGPASATVLVHWGDDDELPEWGTHVLSYEDDLGRHLLWEARYFEDVPSAWADLRDRMPAWEVMPRGPGRRSTGRPPGPSRVPTGRAADCR